MRIKNKHILVVGDVMLDNYYVGDVRRISPEAPVPVFRKRSERSVLGGAANVAANLVAANQQVSMMSIVGNDDNGRRLMAQFGEQGVDAKLVSKLQRSTTIKTRFLADNNQQILRLVVGADTGLMHCAGALGKPSLTLFGCTDPKEYLPFGKNSKYICANAECSPCFGTLNSVRCEHKKCMQLISVEEVYTRIIDMLKI